MLNNEFYSEMNDGKKLTDFTESSARKMWWKCSVNPRHIWNARIFSRTKQGAGCPYCTGKKVLPEDSLAHNHPNLMQEWSKENKFDPYELHCNSGKKVKWICKNGHEWEAYINHRVSGGRKGQGTGCPYCSRQKVCLENSIVTTNPEYLEYWDFTKNTISPAEVFSGTGKKVWWKCPVADDHEWEAAICNRKITGCPCCCGRKIVKSNCLETTHPHIAKEWHPTKNKLKPSEVTYATNKKAWFVCSARHEWCTHIYTRTKNKSGCPECATSKGEKIIKECLEKEKLTYIRQFKLQNCRNERPLPFDFAVFSESGRYFLIEFQGKQHYKPSEFFGGEKSLDRTQKTDKIKFEFCKNNNIPLLSISYLEMHKIEKKLLEFIEEFKCRKIC